MEEAGLWRFNLSDIVGDETEFNLLQYAAAAFSAYGGTRPLGVELALKSVEASAGDDNNNDDDEKSGIGLRLSVDGGQR
jgi:hypothetical protein